MTFGDLITSVEEDLFPSGVPENLVNSLRKFFVQSIVELETAVSCLRYANTDFYAQCGTYFNCGMTVLPKPNGAVLRLFTIGKNAPAKGQTNGTVIGTVAVDAPILQLVNGALVSLPTSGTVASITADGVYSISVAQSNPLASLYPANSPQYFRTTITYVDTDGIQQTVQPTDLMHMSDSSKNGSLNIDCKAGTDVRFTASPFNQPQVDGSISITATLTAGASGVSDDDWCSRIYYSQVDYAHVERYVKACNSCSNSSLWTVANAILANIFGSWRTKRRYKNPTDIGFESLPPLPPGFHYPQTSTDAGGRNRGGGMYAIKHGRIYVTPWIESTESVVVEWNGIKTNWADSDLVTDDPMFIEAVRLRVAIQHYTHYEDNPARLAEFKRKYHGEPGAPGALRELIVACREKTRVRSLHELGSTDGDAAGGIGITSGATSSTGTYYNSVQSYTASCPSGQAGEPVTVTTAAGLYSSTMSQADADAQAMAAAQQGAQSKLSCVSGQVFLNAAQTYVAQCPGASGSTPAAVGPSVSITIPAGTYKSTISQAFADAAALEAATATALSQLVCTYYNGLQTANVTCVIGSESATVPAGQFTSTVSQADADQQAMSLAQSQATDSCTNPAGAFNIGNTVQTVTYSSTVTTSCGTFPFAGQFVVPANTYIGQTDVANQAAKQNALNQQAIAAAQVQIAVLKAQYQIQSQARCRGGFGSLI